MKACELYAMLKTCTLEAVQGREEHMQFVTTAAWLACDLGIDDLVAGALLKQLRNEGRLQLVQAFNEDEGLLAGSGYMLTAKERRNGV